MSTIALSENLAGSATRRTAKYEVLLGALLIQLILGTIYGYSIFWAPLEQAVWTQAAADAPVAAAVHETADRQAYLKYSFSICVLAFAGTMIFAGRLQDIIGPRSTALIGGAVMAAGFLVASQISRISADPQQRVFLLWLTIGLLAGVGVGFAYVCPIAALVKWFPRHKGLMSGIAVAGFGFGAYVFAQKNQVGAAGFLLKYDIEMFFLVHGLICLVAIGLGALLLRNPPDAPTPVKGPANSAAGNDYSWRQTLRSGRFYLLWLMFFSGSLAGLMVITILKPFAGAQLVAAAGAAGTTLSDALRGELLLKGTAAVGILAIFNALGRIFWGLASDRIGRTAALVCTFVLQGLTMLLLTRLQTEWWLAVGAASVGFNYGGLFALFPSLTADLFGSKNLGANYGWVFTSYGIAGLAGVWAGNEAYRRTESYFAAFALAAILCFLSAVLAVVLRRLRPLRAAASA